MYLSFFSLSGRVISYFVFLKVKDRSMNAKVAVVTVSGKAYYMLVDELKRRNMAFLSLTPQDEVPLGLEVVITTKEESALIRHPNVLIFEDFKDPAVVIDEAVRLIRGKDCYETIIMGIDPGKTTGIAVLADADVIEAFTVSGLRRAARSILELSKRAKAKENIVKVGDGAPIYSKELLHLLDKNLSEEYTIETVSEAGTNRSFGDGSCRRVARDAMAAVRIAERKGRLFPRGNMQ